LLSVSHENRASFDGINFNNVKVYDDLNAGGISAHDFHYTFGIDHTFTSWDE